MLTFLLPFPPLVISPFPELLNYQLNCKLTWDECHVNQCAYWSITRLCSSRPPHESLNVRTTLLMIMIKMISQNELRQVKAWSKINHRWSPSKKNEWKLGRTWHIRSVSQQQQTATVDSSPTGTWDPHHHYRLLHIHRQSKQWLRNSRLGSWWPRGLYIIFSYDHNHDSQILKEISTKEKGSVSQPILFAYSSSYL